MEKRSRKGSDLDASHAILRTQEITRQLLETSRNGAMEERSEKGSDLNVSHVRLWNTGEHTSIPGNFPQWGNGGTFQERFKSRCISQIPENIGDCMSVPGNFPQRGDGEKFPERFRCLDPTQSAEFE